MGNLLIRIPASLDEALRWQCEGVVPICLSGVWGQPFPEDLNSAELAAGQMLGMHDDLVCMTTLPITLKKSYIIAAISGRLDVGEGMLKLGELIDKIESSPEPEKLLNMETVEGRIVLYWLTQTRDPWSAEYYDASVAFWTSPRTPLLKAATAVLHATAGDTMIHDVVIDNVASSTVGFVVSDSSSILTRQIWWRHRQLIVQFMPSSNRILVLYRGVKRVLRVTLEGLSDAVSIPAAMMDGILEAQPVGPDKLDEEIGRTITYNLAKFLAERERTSAS